MRLNALRRYLVAGGLLASVSLTMASSKVVVIVPDSEWDVPVQTNFEISKLGSWHGTDDLDVFFSDEATGEVDTTSLAFDETFVDGYTLNSKGNKINIDEDVVGYGDFVAFLADNLVDQTISPVDTSTLVVTKAVVKADTSHDKHGDSLHVNVDIEFKVDATIKGKVKTVKGKYSANGHGIPVAVDAPSAL